MKCLIALIASCLAFSTSSFGQDFACRDFQIISSSGLNDAIGKLRYRKAEGDLLNLVFAKKIDVDQAISEIHSNAESLKIDLKSYLLFRRDKFYDELGMFEKLNTDMKPACTKANYEASLDVLKQKVDAGKEKHIAYLKSEVDKQISREEISKNRNDERQRRGELLAQCLASRENKLYESAKSIRGSIESKLEAEAAIRNEKRKAKISGYEDKQVLYKSSETIIAAEDTLASETPKFKEISGDINNLDMYKEYPCAKYDEIYQNIQKYMPR